MKPGIYNNLTNEEYHSTTAISASFLKSWILYSPFHAQYGKSDISQLIADIGTATHSESLEPEKGNVVLSTEKTRATKAFKEHYEECKQQGKVLLPQKDYDMIKGLVHGVEIEEQKVGGLHNDPACAKLLKAKDKICEASLFAEHGTGLMLKARPDIYSKELKVMGDVKTAQDASPMGFSRDLFRRGYHIQAAHYLLLAEANGWEVKNWGFLAVSKTYPYPAHYHSLSDNAIAYGKMLVNRALIDIAKAKETGIYPTNWGAFSTHELPQWLPESEEYLDGDN